VKDKKFGATAAGTVYRRTSKRRVQAHVATSHYSSKPADSALNSL
jgi:hypothetical protein